MSTSTHVFGQLSVPETRIAELRTAKLRALGDASFFGGPIAKLDGLGFIRIGFKGSQVTIRGALGEDMLLEWAGRIGAFVRAAAALGGRGEVYAIERAGAFGHRLVANGKKAKETTLRGDSRLDGLLRTPAALDVVQILEGAASAKDSPANARRAPGAKAPSQKVSPQRASTEKRSEPPGVAAAAWLRSHPEQVARVVASATGQSAAMNRAVAAEAIVRAGDAASLDAVARQLEGGDWRGGPLACLSVAALFKLDPATALDRLSPYVVLQKKNASTPIMPVLHAFEVLVMGPSALALPGLDLPADLLARDPRWLDLAAELEGASFLALKGLPKKLLAANKGRRPGGRPATKQAPKSAAAKAEAQVTARGFKPVVLRGPKKRAIER